MSLVEQFDAVPVAAAAGGGGLRWRRTNWVGTGGAEPAFSACRPAPGDWLALFARGRVVPVCDGGGEASREKLTSGYFILWRRKSGAVTWLGAAWAVRGECD